MKRSPAVGVRRVDVGAGFFDEVLDDVEVLGAARRFRNRFYERNLQL
jgi:hypothetical protein